MNVLAKATRNMLFSVVIFLTQKRKEKKVHFPSFFFLKSVYCIVQSLCGLIIKADRHSNSNQGGWDMKVSVVERANHNSRHGVENYKPTSTATGFSTGVSPLEVNTGRTHTAHRPKHDFFYSVFSRLRPYLNSLSLQTVLCSIPTPVTGAISLSTSAYVRGCPGVSVMTKSQCSFLPISLVVITQTHMELSIIVLLHTGTPPPSRERERGREGASNSSLTSHCANEEHEERSVQLL